MKTLPPDVLTKFKRELRDVVIRTAQLYFILSPDETWLDLMPVAERVNYILTPGVLGDNVSLGATLENGIETRTVG